MTQGTSWEIYTQLDVTKKTPTKYLYRYQSPSEHHLGTEMTNNRPFVNCPSINLVIKKLKFQLSQARLTVDGFSVIL